ncbi:acyl carrier protein [Burkholderia plantarii]|uniref:acyl carrier protein n=1 Tax=Burkholderia plantarii TaxID=41899 RepID=UPI000870A6E3|nr:acyl carrier protein [Burkholderia plantarii]
MKSALRKLIAELNCLDLPVSVLTDSTDLYAVGLTSLDSVQLLLEVEHEFGIVVPDAMLSYELFSSIDSLAAAIAELQRLKAAPAAPAIDDGDGQRVAAAPAAGR